MATESAQRPTTAGGQLSTGKAGNGQGVPTVVLPAPEVPPPHPANYPLIQLGAISSSGSSTSDPPLLALSPATSLVNDDQDDAVMRHAAAPATIFQLDDVAAAAALFPRRDVGDAADGGPLGFDFVAPAALAPSGGRPATLAAATANPWLPPEARTAAAPAAPQADLAYAQKGASDPVILAERNSSDMPFEGVAQQPAVVYYEPTPARVTVDTAGAVEAAAATAAAVRPELPNGGLSPSSSLSKLTISAPAPQEPRSPSAPATPRHAALLGDGVHAPLAVERRRRTLNQSRQTTTVSPSPPPGPVPSVVVESTSAAGSPSNPEVRAHARLMASRSGGD